MGMMMSPRGKGKRYKPVAEINVTPFVDVMLVLLIIFMVTAPLLAVGVPVDLPKTKASQISSEELPLVISIQNSGKIYLSDFTKTKQNRQQNRKKNKYVSPYSQKAILAGLGKY